MVDWMKLECVQGVASKATLFWGKRMLVLFCIVAVFGIGNKASGKHKSHARTTPAKRVSHKMLPAYMQKAYTLQKDAFVYARPNFDSLRITSIPAGTKVTISRKLYRPKTNFGTFYRIYLSRPKKIRAYISEIDVVPHYVRKGLGYQINPEFKQVKKKLHRVKQFSANDISSSESAEPIDLGTADISEVRWIGLTINHFWLRYKSQEAAFHSWLFNLKLSGSHLVISKVMTDIDIGLAFTPTVVEGRKIEKGYVIISDFLLKYPLVEVPHFLFSLGSGVVVKGKGARPPEPASVFQIGMGLMGSMHLILRKGDRLSFSLEGKSYYDFQDKKFSYTVGGGLLVAF